MPVEEWEKKVHVSVGLTFYVQIRASVNGQGFSSQELELQASWPWRINVQSFQICGEWVSAGERASE